jgi:Leucine-rich repeat (LRR) protein
LVAVKGSLTGRLDLSGFDKLLAINCYDNAIDAIDVSGCASLETLDISSNQLTQVKTLLALASGGQSFLSISLWNNYLALNGAEKDLLASASAEFKYDAQKEIPLMEGRVVKKTDKAIALSKNGKKEYAIFEYVSANAADYPLGGVKWQTSAKFSKLSAAKGEKAAKLSAGRPGAQYIVFERDKGGADSETICLTNTLQNPGKAPKKPKLSSKGSFSVEGIRIEFSASDKIEYTVYTGKKLPKNPEDLAALGLVWTCANEISAANGLTKLYDGAPLGTGTYYVFARYTEEAANAKFLKTSGGLKITIKN